MVPRTGCFCCTISSGCQPALLPASRNSPGCVCLRAPATCARPLRLQVFSPGQPSCRVPDGRDRALNEAQRGGEAGCVLALAAQAVRCEVVRAHGQTDGRRRQCAVVMDEALPPSLLLVCSRDRVQALVLAFTAHNGAVCASSPDRRQRKQRRVSAWGRRRGAVFSRTGATFLPSVRHDGRP